MKKWIFLLFCILCGTLCLSRTVNADTPGVPSAVQSEEVPHGEEIADEDPGGDKDKEVKRDTSWILEVLPLTIVLILSVAGYVAIHYYNKKKNIDIDI